MIDNYVNCEECAYQNICHNFDPFFGCSDGKNKDCNDNNVDNMEDE